MELSPEYGQTKLGGSQENGMAGASFYLTPAVLNLVGQSISFLHLLRQAWQPEVPRVKTRREEEAWILSLNESQWN